MDRKKIKKNLKKFKTKIKKSLSYLNKYGNAFGFIVAFLSLLFVIISTKENTKLVTKTIAQTNEQLQLQKKSIPASFLIDYESPNQYNEQAFITNTGKTKLLNLTGTFEFYFIFRDGSILSNTNIKNKVFNDTLFYNKIKENGLINYPTDFDGLFGTSREFTIDHLNSNEKSLLDISSSAIQNAIRLNDILESKLFTRWTISYNSELSYEEQVVKEYIWINKFDEQGNSLFDFSPRENLKNVIGGNSIISIINEYETNTKDVIFGRKSTVGNNVYKK